MVIEICRKYSFTVVQALELRLDLEVQSAATADSITGPEEGQKRSARFSNKSTIFKVSLFILYHIAVAYSPLALEFSTVKFYVLFCKYLYKDIALIIFLVVHNFFFYTIEGQQNNIFLQRCRL